MRAKLLLCLIFIAMTPSAASATDYTGFLTIALFAFIMIPGMVINLIVMIVFATRRRYVSPRFALTHSCVASAVLVAGVLLTLHDHTSGYQAHDLTESRNAAVSVYAGLLVLAWLPMLLHRLTPRRALPADA